MVVFVFSIDIITLVWLPIRDIRLFWRYAQIVGQNSRLEGAQPTYWSSVYKLSCCNATRRKRSANVLSPPKQV